MPIDSSKARAKIESIDELPTLPTVASEIVAIANSPKTSATDVGGLITKDTALTSKVLKLVNSSFYGFPQQIKTINHAIVILGFNKVKNVVLTASVFDLTKGRSSQRLDIARFWEHALGTAIGSQVAASLFGRSLAPDDAFVGGLLHDFGKVILDQFLPEEYEPVFAYLKEHHTTIQKAEKEIIGFDHQTVGTWVAEKWRLPGNLLAAIRYHNNPAKARDEREMAAAVHVGDILARALGVGSGGDLSIPALDDSIISHYSIDDAFIKKAVKSVATELRKADVFFSMISEDA
ncbi:MAG: HDOD domain-containing protein [Planctomycetota bacterium]|jgi:HD-like signal output (HDOD) protein